ncbi:hypothetical protein PoB_000241000 [Plakobranchus ocellatus]|uniref:Uncharacterized protein n=1 Tax=Plakobranchus ocellatus TaxID=259542 RepID=A0AAV3XYK7_9GAST|nr:hypothetical protein PoB_000241000 [Plakobranchus ocellatus]
MAAFSGGFLVMAFTFCSRVPCMDDSLGPQQDDFKLLSPPFSQGADGRDRARDRRVPADLRAPSLASPSLATRALA